MGKRSLRSFLGAIFFMFSAVALAAPEFVVSPDYLLVREDVDRRGTTYLTLRMSITNIGDQSAAGINAFATSSDPGLIFRDDRVVVGDLGNGVSKVPVNTFKVIVPAGVVFDPLSINWTFKVRRVIENLAPIADAGDDRTAFVGETVMLDGSGSSDPEGSDLKYFWSLVSVPDGSGAVLSDERAIMPSFTVDVAGDYVARLIVRDNRVVSGRPLFGNPSFVTITTNNTQPVADAGPDQNATPGALVQLDGTGSFDSDGDPLSFSWSFTGVPIGSGAVIAPADAPNPTFTADLSGQYEVQLIVNDGFVDSLPDTMLVATGSTNIAPVADAGPDLADEIAATVLLDGSGSFDANGDPLSFDWSLISLPGGSTATLSDATSTVASFVPDLPGQYVAQLIVNDGQLNSAPDTALVTIDVGNTQPVADAGPDQSVITGSIVSMDGSGSFDADGDGLTFTWSITSKPASSLAELSNPFEIAPTFEADVRGSYVIQLIVNDGMIPSDPDSAIVTATNRPPVADAGPDQNGNTGDLINLDGAGSFDADGDPLTYSWIFLSQPAGSTAVLGGSSTATPSFTIDEPGVYEIQLIVNDGFDDSAPDVVSISAGLSGPQTTPDNATTLEDNEVTIDVLFNDSHPTGDPLLIVSVTDGTNGLASTDGSTVTYTPAANFNGEDSFTYTVRSVNDLTPVAIENVTVSVGPVNDQPYFDALPDIEIDEDSGSVVVPLTNIDAGPPNEDQVLTIVASSDDTALIPDPVVTYTSPDTSGSIEFTPEPDANGETTITVTLSDDGGTANGGIDSISRTFTVTVNPVNDAPTIDPLANMEILEDAPEQIVNLTGITTGAANEIQVLTVTAASSDPLLIPDPAVTYTSADATGSITFTPLADAFGTATITVTVTDDGGTPNGGADQTSVTFDVVVTPVNDAPTLDPIPGQDISQNAGLQNVNLSGIGSGAANEIQGLIVTATSDNTALIPNPGVTYSSPDATGSLSYTPVTDETGTATITVTVMDDGGTADGGVDTFSRTFVIDVDSVNTDPVAFDDGDSVDENTVDNLIDVLLNDFDADGDTLTILSFTQPANGTVTDNGGSSLLYTPDPDFDGIDTFTYQASDGNGGTSNSATVTINVENINQDPNAVDDPAITTDEDIPVIIPVLINDSDPDGDSLTVASVTVPTSGTTSTDGTTVTYTPSPNFSGVDQFVYTIIDGNGGSDSATVTVTVDGVNDDPIAIDDIYNIDEDTVSPLPVLDNDSDPDFDSLTITNIVQGTLGNAVAIGGGITYTPLPNVSGQDTLSYTISDGNGGSASASVTINIDPVNDRPVADAGPDQNVNVTDLVTLDGSGSSDVDGPTINYIWSLSTRPVGSSAVLADANTVAPTFTPDVAGDYVASLQVNDGIDSSLTSDTVTITAVSGPPTTITLTPVSSTIETNDSLTMTVTLDQPALAGGQLVNLSSSSGVISVPASVTVLADQVSVTFDADAGLATGSANVTASAAGLVTDISSIFVELRTFSATIPLIGLGRTVTATINLPKAAPTGGVTFDVSVQDTNIATVGQPTVTIPEGQISGSFDITGGLVIGDSFVDIDGTAFGYENQSIPISATDRLIDLPTSEELAFGESRDLLVLIAPDPAPAGGVTVDIASSDPALVQVITPTVVIPEGEFDAVATIQASTTLSGTVTISGSSPSFSTDFTQVTVTRALNILETTESFGSAETEQTYVQISSGSNVFPAPPGGVSVTFSSDDTDCVIPTSPSLIAEGETFAATTLSYGGVAALPCSATITADNPVFGSDTVLVTVEDLADIGTITVNPSVWLSSSRLGSGLQGRTRVTLSEPSHGGVTIQIESVDPGLLRVANDALTPGTPVIEVFFPDGTAFQDIWVQGVRGATGTDLLAASHPEFTGGSAPVVVTPAGLQISGLIADTNTLAADDSFSVRTYSTNGAGAIFTEQPVSAEGPLTITVSSSDPGVGVPTSLAQPSTNPVTYELAVNESRTPVTIGGGGLGFDALSGGSTTISATAPGADPAVAASSQVVNVALPEITVSPQTWLSSSRLGSGLQGRTRITLDGSAHGGVTITVTSDNDSLLRVAPDATTLGAASIDVFFPDGTSFPGRLGTGCSRRNRDGKPDSNKPRGRSIRKRIGACGSNARRIPDCQPACRHEHAGCGRCVFHSYLLDKCGRGHFHGAAGQRRRPADDYGYQLRSDGWRADVDGTTVNKSGHDRITRQPVAHPDHDRRGWCRIRRTDWRVDDDIGHRCRIRSHRPHCITGCQRHSTRHYRQPANLAVVEPPGQWFAGTHANHPGRYCSRRRNDHRYQ